MKTNFKKPGFFVVLREIFRIVFLGLFSFVKRIQACFRHMKNAEKKIVLILIVIALTLTALRGLKFYQDNTDSMPKIGGKYLEAVVGDVKYINPVLASTDAEKSVDELLFSGLVKIDKDGAVLPDVAVSWEASNGNLDYTFKLRDDIYFHDKELLNAYDVAYTIELIQDPNMKSPLYNTWKDVEVTVISDNELVFGLPKPYGPFIYNCDFKIIPDHITASDFSKKFIGSGPYKYISSSESENKITEMKLARNDQYYLEGPYIKTISLNIYSKESDAASQFLKNDYDGVSGYNISDPKFTNFSVLTCRQLALIPNLRVEKFKDKDFRSKVLGDFTFPDPVNLVITTLDFTTQREKAEELKADYAKRNINIEIKYLAPVEMNKILEKKDFELLLYGFDFTHDRDPYVFWHSSQADKKNLAGYSDKKSDILLEDARMIFDQKDRNAKYDEFFATVDSEKLALYFGPLTFQYQISSKVLGVPENTGCEALSRYYSVNKWYLEEKRVRRQPNNTDK